MRFFVLVSNNFCLCILFIIFLNCHTQSITHLIFFTRIPMDLSWLIASIFLNRYMGVQSYQHCDSIVQKIDPTLFKGWSLDTTEVGHVTLSILIFDLLLSDHLTCYYSVHKWIRFSFIQFFFQSRSFRPLKEKMESFWPEKLSHWRNLNSTRDSE